MNNIELEQFCKNLNEWFVENDFQGYDPYQLDASASGLIRKFPLLKQVRKLMKPFHVYIPKLSFVNFPKIYYPKALGLIIGGNVDLYSTTNDEKYLQQARELLGKLLELKSPNFKYLCWGHIFEWGSTIRYPSNTPVVCVTSPIAHALLDLFELTRDNDVLEMCRSVSQYLRFENNYSVIDDEKICLHYSPIEKDLAVNPTAQAAAFLMRLSKYATGAETKTFARKLTNYVLAKQNADGSWNYSETSSMIDNRHTVFVIEALSIIQNLEPRAEISFAIRTGLDYYRTNLMDGFLPKWTRDQTYPIDIHDVAQCIILYNQIAEPHMAEQIINFVIEKMSNGKDEFYFKYFKNSKVNKNVFFRWGQAWMYKALCQFIGSDVTNDHNKNWQVDES